MEKRDILAHLKCASDLVLSIGNTDHAIIIAGEANGSSGIYIRARNKSDDTPDELASIFYNCIMKDETMSSIFMLAIDKAIDMGNETFINMLKDKLNGEEDSE